MSAARIAIKEPVVLIVEDSAPLRALAREALRGIGFEVAEAADGTAGLEFLQHVIPHLIILDVRMPGIDGFETCRRIRSLPRCVDVPILMITALDDMDSINSAYEAGATDFLTKPVNWVLFGHRVRYMLRASRSFRELRSKEARLAEAQQIARLGYFAFRPEEDRMICSEELHRIFALPRSGIDSHEDFLAYVHADDRTYVREARLASIRADRPYNIRYRMIAGDGTQRFVNEQARSNPHLSTGQDQLIGAVQDITERQKIEEQIEFLAYRDSLTGLPNRRLFEDRFREALTRADASDRQVACMFVDLDRFKRVNDTHGHTIGDELLQQVSKRLAEAIRATDTVSRSSAGSSTIARFGGDEFTVLLERVRNQEEVAQVARRLTDVMAEPFCINGVDTFVTASIGIACYPDHGHTVEQLFQLADTAMYAAKERGRNNVQFYAENMQEDASERLSLQSRLHRALERGEFELHYQPICDMRSGEIRKLEALLRWVHPEEGVVPPLRFIPLAEETGLILPIGEWVIGETCRQWAAWRDSGIRPPALAINLSARQFQAADLACMVGDIAATHRCDPAHLEIEITESTLMENSEANIRVLESLKAMGVGLAVDDFGTGYSSLAYLKRFPIDWLKIDRSFVTDLSVDADDGNIVSAIIAMAHNLRLGVVAEGVEEQEQFDYLRTAGCDMVQGYLLAPPRPASMMGAMLRKARLLPAISSSGNARAAGGRRASE